MWTTGAGVETRDLGLKRGGKDMRVRLRSDIRTCFLSLPPSFCDELRKEYPVGAVVVELEWEGPSGECRAFASWNGARTTEQGVMEMGEAFGVCLGLDLALRQDPYLPVRVSTVDYAEYAGSVELEPCTADDWELVELHAGYLEDQILRQVVVLYSQQVLPIFIHHNKVIHLRVLHLPASRAPQRLGPDTEVMVAPRPRRPRQPPPPENGLGGAGPCPISPPLRVQRRKRRRSRGMNGDQARADPPAPTSLAVWLHPLTAQSLQLGASDGRTILLWPDHHASSEQSATSDANGRNGPRCRALATVLYAHDVLPGHVAMGKSLRLQLSLSLLECVRLRPLATHESPVSVEAQVTLRPIQWLRPANNQDEGRAAQGRDDGEEEEEEELKGRAAGSPQPTPEVLRAALQAAVEQHLRSTRSSCLPLCDGAVLVLNKVPYTLALTPPSNQPAPPLLFLLLSPTSTLPLPSLGTETIRPWTPDSPHPPAAALGGVDHLTDKAIAHLSPLLVRPSALSRLCCRVPAPSALLVHGQSCRGKTAICRAVAERLRLREDAQAATVWVDCKSLRGSKMGTVLGELTSALVRARHMAPSVLVLDDLDALAPSESDDGGEANLQAAEIADHLAELWREQTASVSRLEDAWAQSLDGLSLTQMDDSLRMALESSAVSVSVALIATAGDPNQLHVELRRAGLFETQLEVPPLDGKARDAILRALLRRHSQNRGEGVEVESLAMGLEGCSPADLEVVVGRAAHQAVARTITSALLEQDDDGGDGGGLPDITSEDLAVALDGFTPASLRGAKLFKSDVRWQDIGGLEEVQRELRDILEIPVRFAPLYARMPMRLPTGVLLYGPPGCGKTLLAGAVAKECSLNFISIKGPEVLDKYIGASELAVRNLFARASAASPCVLFFDEFEALAPRRGNDNTGVTDRVVNQLLTFLDGVEGRTGVYVMAATSRPDMIDPALLRPGRLDRQLYCGFPTGPERALILQALARKMELTEEAMEALDDMGRSSDTEMLTGADLQALLSTAQLNAIHDRLASLTSTPGEEEGGEAAYVVVTKAHLLEALAATRPSIAPRDRLQYASIYDRFRSSRKADFRPASATDDGTLRTALR